MNERIQELAEQSGAMFDHMTWVERDLAPVFEKFAQLIVKECDRYVAEHYDQMEPWTNSGHLLKHFGIEQQE